jgi:arylsulfatase A-like enzyme
MMKPLCAIVVILTVAAAVRADDRPPNIVFIVADDLGWTDLNCYGSDYYETPHIDALAARGMRFTAAYASPNCAPTRACLMSGQYTPRHGVYTVGSPERGRAEHRTLVPPPNRTVLSTDISTWAKSVREAGYFTAHVGKWHLGDPPDHGPQQHGFDANVAGFRAGTPPGGYFVPYRNPFLPDGPEGEYLTDRLVDETVRLIREHRDRPFFVYLAHYAPHTPI